MEPDTIKLSHSVITQFEHYVDTVSLEADPFVNSGSAPSFKETTIVLHYVIDESKVKLRRVPDKTPPSHCVSLYIKLDRLWIQGCGVHFIYHTLFIVQSGVFES